MHKGKGKNSSVGEALRLAARERAPLIVLEHHGNHWHARCPTDDGGRILSRAIPTEMAETHLTPTALAAAELQWREADVRGWDRTSAGLRWTRLDGAAQANKHDDAGGAEPSDPAAANT